jgi:hypothetical protein
VPVAYSITHNPPCLCRHLPALWQAGGRQAKRAPKPTPNHIALVVRRHVQWRFGFEVEPELME